MRLKVLSLATLVTLIAACEIVEDQTVISKEDYAVANPWEPKDESTAPAKVILANLDSGVDLAHPLIRKNLMFVKDENQASHYVGFDYVANDPLPFPYIINTELYNPQVFSDIKESAEHQQQDLQILLKKLPALSEFISDRRSIESEVMTTALHGTHVAGLMVYDRPEFRLIAERVLPFNRNADSEFDYNAVFTKILEKAVRHAVENGARIINLSLGESFQKPDSDSLDDQHKAYDKNIARLNTVTEIIRSYPNVVFVAAAGNDSSWLDNRSRFGSPCGIPSKNVLCVGALDADNNLASYTNIPVFDGVDLVFALGSDVVSTIPTNMCTNKRFDDLMTSRGQEYLNGLDAEFLQGILDECRASRGFASLSGTSMATPIVSHMMGDVLAEHPEYNAEQAIQALKAKAQNVTQGPLQMYKLKIERPSWYTNKPVIDKDGNISATISSQSSLGNGSWDLLVPQAD